MDEPAFFYQTPDPIHNMQVKVTIRQVRGRYARSDSFSQGQASGADDSAASSHDDIGESKQWSATFGWQQKELGPREVCTYWPDSASGGGNGRGRRSFNGTSTSTGTGAEPSSASAYRAQLEQAAREDRAPADVLFQDSGAEDHRVKLFTYVDKDGFVPASEVRRRVVQNTADDTPSGHGSVHNKLQAMRLRTGEHIPKHLQREMECRCFYIMAAVDLTPEQLEPGSDGSGVRDKAPIFEKCLCAIRLFSHGLLAVQPGFSGVMDEPEGGATEDVFAGAGGGAGAELPPRIHSFTFSTPQGSTYEYTVENLNEVYDVDEEAQMVRADETHAAEQSQRWRLLAGSGFDRPPPEGQRRVFVNAEIVSAANFDEDRLYVQYEVVLPSDGGWRWAADSKQQSGAGTTNADAGRQLQRGKGLPTPRGFSGRSTRRGVSQVASMRYTTAAGFHSRSNGHDGRGDGQDESNEPAAYDESNVLEAVAHFGLPIELELLHKRDRSNPLVGARAPQLFFQVSSCDGWGRHRVAGYGYVDIPTKPGTHECVASTWVPTPTLRSQLKQFFIGGAGQIDDLQSVGVGVAHQGMFFSKHGLRTASSGDVRLRMHVMHQGQPEQVKGTDSGRREGVQTMRKNVQEIIKRLRDAGKLKGTSKRTGYSHVADLVKSLKTFQKQPRVRTDVPSATSEAQALAEEGTGPLSPSRTGRPSSPSRSGTLGSTLGSTLDSPVRGTPTPASQSRRERLAQRRATRAQSRRDQQ